MQTQFKIHHLSHVGALACAAILLFIAYMVVNPRYCGASAADDATATISVASPSNISVSIARYIDVDVSPSSAGAFGKTTTKLAVSTNSAAGYSLYMATADGDSNLKSPDPTNTAVIAPVNIDTSEAEFTGNVWGYSLEDTGVYQPVPVDNASPIKQTDTTTLHDVYDLTFGASVNSDLPTGRYTNSVIISAVANPSVITTLDGATYMQEMTPTICNNTPEHTTKQLIDTRDGNKYWVAKLKDGNCWMTQNLALDITEEGLSHYDTDIEQDWNQGSAYYPPSATNSVPFTSANANKYTTALSWNLGKAVKTDPLVIKACASSVWVEGFTLASKCESVSYVNVGSSQWTTSTEIMVDGTAVDYDTMTYDAHYLGGNYYQWNTATAGTGGAAVSAGLERNASGSICPKGWKLPSSGTNNNTTHDSFYNLLSRYGVATRPTGKVDDVEYNVSGWPLYLSRNGFLYTPSSWLERAGSTGMYWSKTNYGTTIAYNLYIDTAATTTSATTVNYFNNANGLSVRCLAYSE